MIVILSNCTILRRIYRNNLWKNNMFTDESTSHYRAKRSASDKHYILILSYVLWWQYQWIKNCISPFSCLWQIIWFLLLFICFYEGIWIAFHQYSIQAKLLLRHSGTKQSSTNILEVMSDYTRIYSDNGSDSDNNFVNVYIFGLIFFVIILISLLAGCTLRICIRRKNERRIQRREIYFENVHMIAQNTSTLMACQIMT